MEHLLFILRAVRIGGADEVIKRIIGGGRSRQCENADNIKQPHAAANANLVLEIIRLSSPVALKRNLLPLLNKHERTFFIPNHDVRQTIAIDIANHDLRLPAPLSLSIR